MHYVLGNVVRRDRAFPTVSSLLCAAMLFADACLCLSACVRVYFRNGVQRNQALPRFLIVFSRPFVFATAAATHAQTAYASLLDRRPLGGCD